MTDKADTAIRQALDSLVSAHQGVVDAVSAVEDSDEAFDAASEARELLRKMHDEMASLRTQIIGEIWKRDELSLGKLATRIGVSKARAAEITRAFSKQADAEAKHERTHGSDR